MILIPISNNIFVNPEFIESVEIINGQLGRQLIINMKDRSFNVEISESEFFNSINGQDKFQQHYVG